MQRGEGRAIPGLQVGERTCWGESANVREARGRTPVLDSRTLKELRAAASEDSDDKPSLTYVEDLELRKRTGTFMASAESSVHRR